MKTFLCFVLLCFPLVTLGGIKKGVTEAEKITQNMYEEDGSVKLADIFGLPVGSRLRFKLPEQDGTCEGEITTIKTNPNENVAVVGKIYGEGNPGFIFVASVNKTVGGALFFPEKGVSYTLIYDESKSTFLLQKKKFDPRTN